MSDDSPNRDPLGESSEILYLRETPAEDVVGNHLFVLLQLAALRLGETPANLEAAALVIDASAAVLEATGQRLGANTDLYRSALAEVQRAYVRASKAGGGEDAGNSTGM